MDTIRHRSATGNMWAWLKHMVRTPPPPQDAEALYGALQLLARVMKARNPEAAAQLEASADAFNQAIKLTRRHGDVPTNDELTAILSHARLDMQDQFSAQMDLSKSILTAVRGTEAAVGELRATFHAFGERITDVEGRMDQSEADRKAIHKELADAKSERAAILEQLQHVNDFMQRAEKRAASVSGLSEDEQDNVGAWLVEMYRRDKAAREAGDATR
jgi:chromosome segregation ATPase